jgi:hypothetical protein
MLCEAFQILSRTFYATHSPRTSSGRTQSFIKSLRIWNCIISPASKCQAIWQWNAHIPGLSATKRINTHPNASTTTVSLRSGFVVFSAPYEFHGKYCSCELAMTQNVCPWRWNGCDPSSKFVRRISTTCVLGISMIY